MATKEEMAEAVGEPSVRLDGDAGDSVLVWTSDAVAALVRPGYLALSVRDGNGEVATAVLSVAEAGLVAYGLRAAAAAVEAEL